MDHTLLGGKIGGDVLTGQHGTDTRRGTLKTRNRKFAQKVSSSKLQHTIRHVRHTLVAVDILDRCIEYSGNHVCLCVW